ncbi:hypothetical protein Enr13x_67260 [Stieleria neptunia]|uniref:Uncharacterized protein n=1 Tax=Stieleria neptunia TaxID=2527979 RepID=A0A518I1B5_9BACT|nr:hypothetical protein Enr13x_67260 [Stieleria neptunia]
MSRWLCHTLFTARRRPLQDSVSPGGAREQGDDTLEAYPTLNSFQGSALERNTSVAPPHTVHGQEAEPPRQRVPRRSLGTRG